MVLAGVWLIEENATTAPSDAGGNSTVCMSAWSKRAPGKEAWAWASIPGEASMPV